MGIESSPPSTTGTAPALRTCSQVCRIAARLASKAVSSQGTSPTSTALVPSTNVGPPRSKLWCSLVREYDDDAARIAAGASLQYGPTDTYGVAQGAPITTASAPPSSSGVAEGKPRNVPD